MPTMARACARNFFSRRAMICAIWPCVLRPALRRAARYCCVATAQALTITASGHTANIIAALEAARRGALLAVSLCSPESDLKRHCDMVIETPQADPALVHELHLTAGHMFCRLTDYYLFENAVALTPYLQSRHTTEV